MKKFIIKNEMLGSKEVINLLTTPIHKNILALLLKEAEGSEEKMQEIDLFLQPLSIVQSMLKNGCADRLTSFNAYDAVEKSKLLSSHSQRLLGPQLEALLEIAPRLDLLAEIKHYIDHSLLSNMHSRINCSSLLEDTVSILDRMDAAIGTVSEDDYQDVMSIFRTAVGTIASPLYSKPQWPSAKRDNEYDPIAKVAIDAILNEGGHVWPFYTEEDSKKHIERAITLGFQPSEIWAMKVLLIRRICSILHWQFNLSDENEIDEAIDLLKYGYDLYEDVSAYTGQEEDTKRNHIFRQIRHMLNAKCEEIRDACEKKPMTLEHYNNVLADLYSPEYL